MKKMELLAPVGSKEAFITALRGGADAVYMGVPDFNARVSAANINFYDLKVLINHAHEKNVKVFLALNTLIKHEEINDVVKSISYIEKLKPDAVIVQDLGVASIINKYFPTLELHASTQMAVHNRMGVDFLAKNGFKRAIMARELSFSELKSIVKGSPIPIEIFGHGALCFSLSGMCLFSSYIGGLSGNRGRCTQPCRRLWQNDSKSGYLFSPRDLELAAHVNKLKNIGVASLKIEGRMRSSEYVYRVVKAYRMLIDATDADFDKVLKEATQILSNDAAREKTTCLFSGRDSELFQPKKAQCLGNNIGTIESINDGSITIEVVDTAIEVKEGDRLRLSNPQTDTTITFKIKEFLKDGSKYVITFGKAREFAVGNPVFKTVDAEFDQKNLEDEIDAVYTGFAKNNKRDNKDDAQFSQIYTSLISNIWKETKKLTQTVQASDTLWVRFDNIGWLDVLKPLTKNTRYVFYLTKENIHFSQKLIEYDTENIVGELPPFISQRDCQLFKQYIDKMISLGVTKWVVNNVSQFEFFTPFEKSEGSFQHNYSSARNIEKYSSSFEKKQGSRTGFTGTECELTAGHFLYTWNAYTAAFLSGFNVKYFVTSWEDEFLNIRKMAGPGLGKHLVTYLYGYAPVVRSRMITKEMLSDSVIEDLLPAGVERENMISSSFLPVFESELALLIPERPISIFTARRKLKECALSNFGIDLNYIKPDRKAYNTIFAAYDAQENLEAYPKFNFKRGIK